MTEFAAPFQRMLEIFSPLFSDIKDEDAFHIKKPLLAHYTSLQVLEAMLKTGEVWFSNPLYMNDSEEVRFGILQGVPLVLGNAELEKACGSPERLEIFRKAFDYYQQEFGNKHVLDTYVFCLSEHDPSDQDGALSMWRGYGANGDGACVVFDTARMGVIPNSPLLLAKVEYGAGNDRLDWLKNIISRFSTILTSSQIGDDELYIAASILFERIKLFAIFSKHRGFSEEHEWRVVYMPERDSTAVLKTMFDYWIGPKGVEPKLKFKVGPIPGVTGDNLSLPDFIDRIIIGPSISSAVSVAAIHKMLERLGHANLKDKVRASGIPFRPR